ncbi:MAG TPA: MotA/TolQ/ExbB proton channel family protein [Ignavibacteriales bacterium]|nr:MotA/TolQ/ExbB proton channel family protein [Ignavibacteriales bacterium]
MQGLSKEAVIGIILGFGLFIYSIVASTNNYLMFINYPSLLLVVGGTIASTMISFEGRSIIKALKDIGNVLIPHRINKRTLYSEVKTIIEWGRIVRKSGLYELEKQLDKKVIKDDLLRYGTQLLLTGYRGDELRQMLNNATEMTYERHMNQAHILKTMAGVAPAFGMVGTVVGLIIMLDNLGNDPSKIGGGMALALITTLYGVLLAQLIFKPAAEKVQQKEDQLRFRNMLLTEGFVLLSESQDSITIQDRLNSFLDPEIHFSVVKREQIGLN